jgi:riboflavin biosynthesis pyrimidine reductase
MLLPETRDQLSDADLDAAYSWPPWPEPWLRAAMVSTVDGAARSPDGVSEGISSDADRHLFGRLRGLADVVLAGAGTVRAEGYRPAAVKPDFVRRRADAGQAAVPAIAVVSRSLDLDLGSPLFASATVGTLVITSDSADPAALARVREVADVIVAGAHDVDLTAAVDALRARGLHRVHAEGGPSLLGQLEAADLVDELLLTVTPVLGGGSYAGGTAVPRILAGPVLPDAPRALRLHHLLEHGGSLFLSYRRGP